MPRVIPDNEIYISSHAVGLPEISGYTTGVGHLVEAGIQTLADLKDLLAYAEPFLKDLEKRRMIGRTVAAKREYEKKLEELISKYPEDDVVIRL